MSSTQPSLFSTLKVFRFTSSRPPPPPPKDPNYLYSQSNNPSVASLSQNQSRPPSNSPKAASLSPKYNANGNGARSVRSLSPTPTRAAQFPQQLQQQLLQPQPHLLDPSPPAYSSTSTSSQDPNSGAGKRGFFRKVSSLRKRSTSKNLRPATAVEEPTNDESISRPWNFQHHIHIDEAFQGIPPSWSSSLANLGYSDAEIALIMQGRRNRARTPDPSSVQDPPSSMTPSRSHSPTSINPRARSSSLRRQRSDGSISRSERSLRLGPPAPPPALPLPPPPQTASSPIDGSGAPAAPPPTPASGGSALCDTIESDSAETPSEAQYVYVHHQRQTPNGLMAMPPPAPVPVIQPVPVRPLLHSRNNSSSSTNKPLSRSSSARSARERPFKTQFPSPAPFRVVNTTSPPPRYSDDVVRGGSPPSITSDAVWPRSKAKADRSSLSRPSHRDQINTPSPDSSRGTEAPRSASPAIAEGVGRGSKELHVVQEGQDYDSDRSSSERVRSRPSLLSILPPRVSLRKDVLEDLSSWSASLFSSLPSELHDSPGSSHVTATTSISTTLSSKSEIRKHGSKPSVTLPTIILHSEVLEENEDEGDEGDDLIEHDYSHTASPLYHELMGMMQGRAAAANGVSSADSGSPASASFQFEPASSSSHGATSRDSQLTIRFDSGRDGSRDSSASMSTLTHATIVRGASIVRRVRADVVTTSPTIATLKGKEREHGRAPIQIVQEDAVDDNNDDDEEGDSSSDATGSDGDRSSRSPVDTLAFTSGPNSLEDTRSYKCPRQTRGHGSPLPSPAPSPLRASFSEQGGDGNAQSCETQDVSTQGPYVTPPPSAPPVPVRWSPIATPTTNSGGLDDVSSLPLSPALTEPVKEDEKSPVPPRFTSTGVRKPRYPSWLAALVLPLSEFIDDVADPRVLFTDLQEIAQGESGSVYSACAAPAVVSQFRPPTPRSPVLKPSYSLPPVGEGGARQKQELVAIKRVPLLRGEMEKLTDLRCELELTRTLRHSNVLHMERLYVDVIEESLWIGMELLDRSLADVLAVVGEEVGSAQEDSSSGAVVEIPETMVARFVCDALLALSYLRKHHIAHRDVRSDNLLLSRSGVLKLSDFSSAVRSPPGTHKRSDPVGVIYWQAPEMRTGLYDPLKVDVWSLGATTWELVHGDPPFADVQDTRRIVDEQFPPVREPEAYSRSFHDFLHLCSRPAALRPDPDELLKAPFVRTGCSRSEIVPLLGQCKAIDEQQLLRLSSDSHS